MYLKKISIAKNLSIIESETFNDNRSEKMKLNIFSLFPKELNTLIYKCEKLMQNSYSNYIRQIENLRKGIEKKDEIISKL